MRKNSLLSLCTKEKMCRQISYFFECLLWIVFYVQESQSPSRRPKITSSEWLWWMIGVVSDLPSYHILILPYLFSSWHPEVGIRPSWSLPWQVIRNHNLLLGREHGSTPSSLCREYGTGEHGRRGIIDWLLRCRTPLLFPISSTRIPTLSISISRLD